MKPDTKQSQKMAAAISAVFGYIRLQEDAASPAVSLADTAAESVPVPVLSAMPAPVKLWGISGRQDMMSMRNLMQLRTFQGSKLR